MKVKYSNSFEKAVRKLSGKSLTSVKEKILEVKKAESVFQITDCRQLTDFNNVYRIRIGGLRAFFVLHIEITEGVVHFKYLVPRGQAYDKKILDALKKEG